MKVQQEAATTASSLAGLHANPSAAGGEEQMMQQNYQESLSAATPAQAVLARIIHKPAPALACSLIRKGICLSRTYHTGTRLLRQIPLRIKLLRDHRGSL